MLSDQERQQIQREEVASVRALQEEQRARRRQQAQDAYRRQVRATLNPRARNLLAGVTTGLLLLAVALAVLGGGQTVPDDTSGGIATSSLMENCEANLRATVGGDLSFPSRREAAQDISASPDGKRWDGAFTYTPAGEAPVRTEFSCIYTIATTETTTELIAP